MPRLIIIKGADEGKQFELTEPVVGVGRDSANGVRLQVYDCNGSAAQAFRLSSQP